MYSRKELEVLVKKALDKLLELDLWLFLDDVNERTLTHRFAIYLEVLEEPVGIFRNHGHLRSKERI